MYPWVTITHQITKFIFITKKQELNIYGLNLIPELSAQIFIYATFGYEVDLIVNDLTHWT